MNKWRCMIVDDEPVAIRVIRQHLDKMAHYEVVHCSKDARDASEYLSHSAVDLLLLDIEMPELTGIQLFESLEEPPELILVTAHRDYAVEGFELNALDYLMKPVSFPRLVQALERFEQTSLKIGSSRGDTMDFVYVTVDRKKKKILLKDIIYIESFKDYIRIFTNKGKIITRETTTDFEQRLPTGSFLRIHRSFIINMNKIDTVSHDEISLGNYSLPVGRSYKDEAMKVLGIR
jgi:two-component system, LytTR family, response regulator